MHGCKVGRVQAHMEGCSGRLHGGACKSWKLLHHVAPCAVHSILLGVMHAVLRIVLCTMHPAVLQFPLCPLLLMRGFLPRLLSCALYALALSYYHYLSFLGELFSARIEEAKQVCLSSQHATRSCT